MISSTFRMGPDPMPRLRFAFALLFALFSAACLSPARPPRIEYYSAAVTRIVDDQESEVSDDTAQPRALSLRRVTAALHLKQRFVWSKDGVEFGFRELARWTEDPVEYLRRALEDHLFTSSFVRTENAEAARVEVEMRAFEERLEPTRRAHVVLHVRVTGPGGGTFAERLIEEESPIDGDSHAATARAMSQALASAVRKAEALLKDATSSL